MYSREILDQVKAAAIKQAKGMKTINRMVPVSGERIDIQLPDRKINIVYYRAETENAPLIMGYHGGGFLFGGNALNDAMWSSVSKKLGVNVASVGYRKSPDHNYRDTVDDASDVAHYMYEHADEFGFDRKHMSVMGCSAGAQIAAALCIREKKINGLRLDNQILMYPFLDNYTDPDSKGGGSMGGPLLYVFNELHCTPEEAKLPEASPVFASKEELTGLPHAVFCMADNDNLKQEGYKYAEMLKEAGVSCAVSEYEGMPHCFFESGFGNVTEAEMSFLGEGGEELVRSGKIAAASEKALQYVYDNFIK